MLRETGAATTTTFGGTLPLAGAVHRSAPGAPRALQLTGNPNPQAQP